MVEEDPSNIIVTCTDCAEKMYPNKGNFDIKVGDSVKIHFEEEHAGEFMWVKVEKINGDIFEGILNNDPVLMNNVCYGDRVMFTKEEVCDRIRK